MQVIGGMVLMLTVAIFYDDATSEDKMCSAGNTQDTVAHSDRIKQ